MLVRMTISVRPATDADWPCIWPIILEIAASQDTFAMEATPSECAMRASWMTQPPGRVVVAIDIVGQVLGTANMYANRPNQGSHVASGSLMVAAPARARGVGRALVRDMVAWATGYGFRGIQFNAVVASNQRAVRLYESESFRVVGAAPGGFLHPTLGFVDLLVLWRDLP
ncbi:GNAT family N-acetyltransferase [Nocardioides nanhaiensis]|uniref:GNAT family N-acetyltransferase n=1 Tax=Nocardioides nanhaiensis TaxID=1476871 RepID=A0ABP8WD92_9ACTN